MTLQHKCGQETIIEGRCDHVSSVQRPVHCVGTCASV